jgi:carboxyl-terminal processing protease
MHEPAIVTQPAAEADDRPAAGSPSPSIPAGAVPDVDATERGGPGPGPGRTAARRGGGVRASVWLAIVGAVVLAGSGLFAAGFTLGRQTALTDGTPQALAADLQPFWDAFDSIDQRYAGLPVTRQAVIEGAINGMFKALGDPFSSYMTGAAYQASLTGLSGQFEGIGAVITTEDAHGVPGCTPAGPACRIAISRVYPGSPAEAAGLKAADVIEAVDGVSVAGMTTDDVVNLVRGPRGTAVTLRISRDGLAPFDARMVRAIINPQDVTSRVIAGGTLGYIRISSFGSGVAADFTHQLRTLMTEGVRGIVLDLRGDPGGFVDQARTIASQFIGSGPIYWEQNASGARRPVDAEPGGIATNPRLPLIVLVDKGSASASEILAGALQATGRGRLLGTTTYGKGTVQEWQLLGQGMGGFRLTIARWLTPDKVWISGKGLTPNIAYQAPANAPVGTDPVLERAVQVLTGAAPGSGPTAILAPAAAPGARSSQAASPVRADATGATSSGASGAGASHGQAVATGSSVWIGLAPPWEMTT